MLARVFNQSLQRKNWPWIAAWVAGCAVIAALGIFAFTDVGRKGKADPFKQQAEEDKTPPALNANTPPGPAPPGMVWIPGGEFYMGIDPEEFTDLHPNPAPFFSNAWPVHKVYVDGLWMDKTEVTNEEFAKFVKATGYVTVAEKQPDPKEFPNVPKEDLKPFSIVFKKPEPHEFFGLQHHEAWMKIGYGASWKNPEGPGSNLDGREKHPAVHISYVDAEAYCKWAKKRLPTEAEWEFGSRGGLDRNPFCWGKERTPDGKYMANYWQGRFPLENDAKDGFAGTAPVGSFPANGYGVHDMVGNVWEWCADWFQEEYYRDSPNRNPKGPDFGFDLREQGVPKRVQRGGSFLCADNYCMRYLPGARGKGEPTSAASHIGFRCVKDAK